MPENTRIAAQKGLDALKRRRKELQDQIQRLRTELLALEFSIRTVEQPEAHTLFAEEEMHDVMTKGGSFRGLEEKILETLKRRGKAMTGSEIADALYSFAWTIPLAVFQRRVIVKTSAMFREPKAGQAPLVRPSGWRAKNKEIYWALAPWFQADGTLPPWRKPIPPNDGDR